MYIVCLHIRIMFENIRGLLLNLPHMKKYFLLYHNTHKKVFHVIKIEGQDYRSWMI